MVRSLRWRTRIELLAPPDSRLPDRFVSCSRATRSCRRRVGGNTSEVGWARSSQPDDHEGCRPRPVMAEWRFGPRRPEVLGGIYVPDSGTPLPNPTDGYYWRSISAGPGIGGRWSSSRSRPTRTVFRPADRRPPVYLPMASAAPRLRLGARTSTCSPSTLTASRLKTGNGSMTEAARARPAFTGSTRQFDYPDSMAAAGLMSRVSSRGRRQAMWRLGSRSVTLLPTGQAACETGGGVLRGQPESLGERRTDLLDSGRAARSDARPTDCRVVGTTLVTKAVRGRRQRWRSSTWIRAAHRGRVAVALRQCRSADRDAARSRSKHCGSSGLRRFIGSVRGECPELAVAREHGYRATRGGGRPGDAQCLVMPRLPAGAAADGDGPRREACRWLGKSCG